MVLRETFEAITIAIVLALIIRTFVVQAFKIPSSSMEDTLLIGDHILVSKFSYGVQVPRPAMIKFFGVWIPFFETQLKRTWGDIEHGDVIVFRWPGDRAAVRKPGGVEFLPASGVKEARSKDYIKRVVGLPGDTVEVIDRQILVNGNPWEDPYGVHKGATFGDSNKSYNFGPYAVPEGHVFVMGDNRERSYDSRFWGPVPIADIKGRAFTIYWSWNGEDRWLRSERLGKSIE